LIYNHACGGTVNIGDSIPFLMFLNLASHFQDLWLHWKHLLFNFEVMTKKGILVIHLLLLGLDSPFGKLHLLDTEMKLCLVATQEQCSSTTR
jgi:hypothetical protein